MLVEFRSKSQITIPKELVDKIGLSEGDKLDIFEKDGILCLMPVVIYPKKYLDELRE
jgi:AbrB family looped-hinge helix DNA binding protein